MYVWRSSLQDIRAYRGADVGSDHNLVIGKIHLKLKKATKPEVKKTYATEKRKEQAASENFRMETRNRFAALEHSTDLEEQWQMFVSGVTDSAAKILGKRRGTNKKRWISCETWDLIDERKRTNNARDQTKDSQGWKTSDTKYREKDKEVKKSCRRDKRHWIESKGAEAQEAANRNDTKSMYRIVRELTNSRSISSIPIKSKDGRTLVTEEEQSNRWMEHFKGVLNQPEPTNLIDFEQETPMTLLDVTMGNISIEEVTKSIHTLKNNQAGGLDEVTAELLKHGGETVAEELTYLFNLIWQREEVPGDWRRGAIVKLPKKGNLSDCNNWKGITLLSIPGKVFCSVLLNRLREHVDSSLREEQAGFRKGRSCSEQIFTLRTIIEQSLEHQTPLIINFIDFKKAFDSIHRESLWKINETLWGPRQIHQHIQDTLP